MSNHTFIFYRYAPDVTNDHPDLPQALVILSEMNVSAQHVATLVDNMLQRVRDGELTTDQGLSFLEMKYHMLLSYLINLTYVVLRKCSGEKIEGDPCIDRLVEIRTVLEKIRPIDQKLKYQIDKLVKSAVTSTNPDDPTSFKAHPENLMEKSDGDSDSEDSEVDFPNKVKTDVYVPPKLSAVHYTGDETTHERNKRLQEKRKKHSLSSSLMQDLKEEYLDVPVEISQSSRAQQITTKQQQERQSYEEEYLTRLPVSKSEKHSRRKLTTLGTLGDEITDFGTSKSNKKRKRLGKSKGKIFKRKRFH
ncbi:something about silencing protein 10-related [Holotrichia oblita]|uniref:Something about silencing protein 10-related n=1 Tax=Holotrichia oblita TaxID=644536 RepID=A0ACB9TF67_HOLOL|nr:something about silencing protein 10-related [Holotrichia oblita]